MTGPRLVFPVLLVMMLPVALVHAADLSVPVELTAEQDHQRSMALLKIDTLRPGANGSDPDSPNAVNYDENFANPYPVLPDPLFSRNRVYVEDAESWWQQRRPEILDQFDREVYGITPASLPSVNWQVVSEMHTTVATSVKSLRIQHHMKPTTGWPAII